MVIKFPRDDNGEIKRKQGCQTPGCDHPNYHVCLHGKEDTTPQILNEQAKNPVRRSTASQMAAMAQGRDERWERYREEHRDRNEKIIKRYEKGDVGIAKIAEQFGIAYTTVRKILVDAKIPIRAPGNNVQHMNQYTVPQQRTGS